MGIQNVLQSINILLVLAVMAVFLLIIFLFINVLLKLNKALDIWLEQNRKN